MVWFSLLILKCKFASFVYARFLIQLVRTFLENVLCIVNQKTIQIFGTADPECMSISVCAHVYGMCVCVRVYVFVQYVWISFDFSSFNIKQVLLLFKFRIMFDGRFIFINY